MPAERSMSRRTTHRRLLFGGSLLWHATLLWLLTAALGPAHRREVSSAAPTSAADITDVTRLVWLPIPGDGGGGGGGGDRTPEPPRRLEQPGRDAVSVPPVEPPISNPPTVQPPEDAAPQTLTDVRILPLASSTLSLPGALDSPSLPTSARGPGTQDGAGTGDNGGIGPGKERGIGPGSGGSVGNGPNRGNAPLILPTLLRDAKPLYTAAAMGARIQGICVVRAIVRTDGTVGDVEVIRSLDPVFGLDQAAATAARKWLFRPGLMAGQPVPVAVIIELTFTLH